MRDEGTGTSILLETERLFLREMDRNDYDALYRVLADTEIMRHYPYTFDEARVRAWIERNMERYRVNGFGLWAVCLKGSGEMIGDCGLTLQTINGNELPEIGYHIRRDFQRRGYAKEAAKAVRDWAFRNTEYPALYSYCRYTNEPSVRTAESIGMHFAFEYPDEANGMTHVSVMSREDWLKEAPCPGPGQGAGEPHPRRGAACGQARGLCAERHALCLRYQHAEGRRPRI